MQTNLEISNYSSGEGKLSSIDGFVGKLTWEKLKKDTLEASTTAKIRGTPSFKGPKVAVMSADDGTFESDFTMTIR